MKTIPTNLASKYVEDWTIVQAIREAMQNIVYGATKTDSVPIIEYSNGIGIMEDNYIGLKKKHLYMGESEQRNDSEGLGTFGEGLKMFLLIFARNSIYHKVETVGFTFWGRMIDAEDDVSILEIVIEDNDRTVGTKITIECDENDFIQGTDGFASVQGISKEYLGEKNLIPDRQKELYIKGVRIQNNETKNPLNLHFAYHIKDASVTNRDRSTVNTEKVYDIIGQIWAKESDYDKILDYVQLAYNGELAEDIQRGPQRWSIGGQYYDVWKKAIAHVMGCREEQLVIPSRNVMLDKEAEYRNYVLVKLPDRWHYMLEWIGVKSVQEVITAKFSEMTVYSIDDLTDYERQVFKRAKIDVKKSLNLPAIQDLPRIKIVEEIVDTNGVTDALGLYERDTKTVYIKRDQLQRQQLASRVLIHECVHWLTGASDNTEWFTNGFENAILNLLGYNK
jgi:hypothetical protein